MGPADPPRPGGRGAGRASVIAAIAAARPRFGSADRDRVGSSAPAAARAARFFAAAGAEATAPRRRRRHAGRPLRFVPACRPSDMPIRTPLASAA